MQWLNAWYQRLTHEDIPFSNNCHSEPRLV